MGKKLLNKIKKATLNLVNLLSEFGKGASYAISH